LQVDGEADVREHQDMRAVLAAILLLSACEMDPTWIPEADAGPTARYCSTLCGTPDQPEPRSVCVVFEAPCDHQEVTAWVDHCEPRAVTRTVPIDTPACRLR
jgi:hypothetical protein